MSLRSQRENARHRQTAGMADAKPPDSYPQRGRRLCCAAGELDFRGRARRAVDHHIGERDSCAKSRAERLEHCLLGGEPPRQSLDPIGPIADLVKFDLNEATRNERVARILDPAPHLGDVNQVNAMSDDVQNPSFPESDLRRYVQHYGAPRMNNREQGGMKR